MPPIQALGISLSLSPGLGRGLWPCISWVTFTTTCILSLINCYSYCYPYSHLFALLEAQAQTPCPVPYLSYMYSCPCSYLYAYAEYNVTRTYMYSVYPSSYGKRKKVIGALDFGKLLFASDKMKKKGVEGGWVGSRKMITKALAVERGD